MSYNSVTLCYMKKNQNHHICISKCISSEHSLVYFIESFLEHKLGIKGTCVMYSLTCFIETI